MKERLAGLVTVIAVTTLLVCPLPALAGYHEEFLDNGLRVILLEHHANPMVSSAVIVSAGLIDETAATNGASHYLEHLLFNGTETRTQRELYDDVDLLGAYNNATTREDHTLFTFLVQKEFAAEGLEIQADMLFHSILPEDKFDKERGIVLEEIAKSRADPGYLAGLEFRAFAYGGTPLERPVLGTEGSIEGMKRDAVHSYYKSRYVPGNMTLVVMGDFEIPGMMATVKKTFGAPPKSGSPPAATGSWPARPEKNLRTVPLEAGRTYIRAGMPLPLSPHDPRMPAVELLVSALAAGKDAPLDLELTSGAEPLALSFSLGVGHRASPLTTLDFDAAIPTGSDPAPLLDALARGLRSLGPGSPARDRIATLRSAARADEVLIGDKIHYWAMLRAHYLVDPPEGYLRDRIDIYDRVDDQALDRAAEVLRNALAGARVVVAGPDLAESQATWSPDTDPVEMASASGQGVSTTLANGLEVGFQRNDDSQVFAVHLMFRPRSASEPEGREGLADFLHRVLLRGTLVRDRAALDAAFTSLGAEIKLHDAAWIPYDDYYTTAAFSFARLEMPADRWEAGLRLLGEMVRYPKLAALDVDAVRAEMQDVRKRGLESPSSVGRGELRSLIAPGHPLSKPVQGTADSLEAITVEELGEFHDAYVSGKRIILTGTGPVAPDRFLRAVEDVFGDLPAGEAPPETPPAPPTAPGLVHTDDEGREQAYLSLGYLFDSEPDDRAALAVAGAMLSDRLSFTLREERGLAYSMGASIGPWGGRMMLGIGMGTRPDNVDEALEGLKQGLREFVESEPDSTEVRKAANALRGRLLMRRMSRVNQSYYAALERLEGRPPGDDRRQIDALLEVTPADVHRVAREYLDPARLATVVVR
jgi:predicted Zn-dependent peptidase